MDTFQLTLRDADEIEQFFLDTTGMKPGYMQLSRGLADLRIRVVELDGVSLIWTRARGRARWCDQMAGDGLHIGFAIESEGPITIRGHDVSADEAQVWMPGEEMDLVLNGPNLTLDIGVEPHLVEEKGWQVDGAPLQKIQKKYLSRLITECTRISDDVREDISHRVGRDVGADDIDLSKTEMYRERVLRCLEPVLQPWQSGPACEGSSTYRASSYFQLVHDADRLFDEMGLLHEFDIDEIAGELCVARRTLFHSFNKVLGVGPRRYIEIKRLHALRARLRKTSYRNMTVSKLAAELGFTDMGRLATIYNRHFGEKPSETLRYG